jgi:hypothetical protein
MDPIPVGSLCIANRGKTVKKITPQAKLRGAKAKPRRNDLNTKAKSRRGRNEEIMVGV